MAERAGAYCGNYRLGGMFYVARLMLYIIIIVTKYWGGAGQEF